jgi:pyridoxal phosphate enzyme (YggS family)
MSVAGSYPRVLERIERAALRVGRAREDVRVVAVTKTFPADVVLEALDAGIRDIGENRAQELRDKATVVGDRAVWHFVGQLQTNKVRHVVGIARLIHSIDRYGLAEAVARRARAIGVDQEVLIEVNIAGERTKHGVEPAGAVALAEEVAALEGVAVKGLMAIPPAGRDPEGSRGYFKELAVLRDRLVARLPEAFELSMGMTSDFEVAVEEGATIVRIGEALFGRRGD